MPWVNTPPALVRWAGEVHTYPLDDLIKHNIFGPCPCGPRVTHYLNGCRSLLHHSLDGREQTE